MFREGECRGWENVSPLTDPNGSVAPENTCPPLVVPMKLFTAVKDEKELMSEKGWRLAIVCRRAQAKRGRMGKQEQEGRGGGERRGGHRLGQKERREQSSMSGESTLEQRR